MKNPRYCFQHSNGTEIISNSLLFRRLKTQFFLTSRDWQDSNSHMLEVHSLNRNTPFTTEARVVRQTHSVFQLVDQVPLYSCAVESALPESCPAKRSPSCERLHRQTGLPLPPPTCVVSSSTYLFGWTGPWRRHTPQRRQHHEDAVAARTKRTKQMTVMDFAHFTV